MVKSHEQFISIMLLSRLLNFLLNLQSLVFKVATVGAERGISLVGASLLLAKSN